MAFTNDDIFFGLDLDTVCFSIWSNRARNFGDARWLYRVREHPVESLFLQLDEGKCCHLLRVVRA